LDQSEDPVPSFYAALPNSCCSAAQPAATVLDEGPEGLPGQQRNQDRSIASGEADAGLNGLERFGQGDAQVEILLRVDWVWTGR